MLGVRISVLFFHHILRTRQIALVKRRIDDGDPELVLAEQLFDALDLRRTGLRVVGAPNGADFDPLEAKLLHGLERFLKVL